MLRHQAKGSFPPRRRPSQFFASRSFSAALSSIDSASSFFRRRFSSSSPFSRAASDGPIPPYFDFQRSNVCSLIPCRRQTSAVGDPPSTGEHTSAIQSIIHHPFVVFSL